MYAFNNLDTIFKQYIKMQAQPKMYVQQSYCMNKEREREKKCNCLEGKLLCMLYVGVKETEKKEKK